MNRVDLVRGTMAPLPRANVDTDQIMPKQFLKRVERSGYGEFLFWDWARDADGELRDDFVLNKPEYADASILVAGPNFGSGSSREHAPWGIQDWGFDAVVAPSFADIFFNNCTKIGLVPVVLTEKEVQFLTELAEQDPAAVVDVSVSELTVTAEGFEARFDLDGHVQKRLLEGLDDISLTLAVAEEIGAFESGRPDWLPSLA